MAEGTVTEGWLHDTLEQLIAQIRALLDVTGVAFVTVDEDRERDPPRRRLVRRRRGLARVHAAARPPLRARARRRHRGGGRVRHARVLIPRMGEWPGRRRRCARGSTSTSTPRPPADVGLLPQRLVHLRARCAPPAGARSACWRSPPARRCARSAPRTCARSRCSRGSPALALERSELLEREAGLRREEGLLNRALQAVAASIDLEAVYRAIVEQAARAVRRHHGAAHAATTRRRASCATSPAAA